MKEFLLDNLVTILGFLGVPLAYIFGGKRAKELELKSKETTIKKDDSEALKSMQEVYDSFLVHFQKQMDAALIKVDFLEKQYTELNLLYHKEIEKSKDWEKKHNDLQFAHDKLKKDFDKLKLSIK